MLTQTFCHIPGVGRETERSLWGQGCLDWDCYLAAPDRFSVGSASKELAREHVERSVEALAEGKHEFFASSLGMGEAWRAWPEFRGSCVYLDIETDGGRHGSSITTIGLYDGKSFTGLVKGVDLGNFPDLISQYSMIVTFFGAGFDLPLLQKCFRNVRFDQIHLDLCPTLRRIGLKGGLKRIERRLGIGRSEDTDGLDGMDAIRLWQRHLRGDDSALPILLAYNREDVVNLEALAEYAYRELKMLTLYGPSPVSPRV